MFASVGAAIELKNEYEIKQKLLKISQIIRDDQKNLIAKYISSKLVIKRRTYLTNLTVTELRSTVTSFEKLTLLFDEDNVHKLKAKIDLKILEAYILSLEVKEVQDFYMKFNFAELFANKIVQMFMGDTKLKTIDPPLVQGEQPVEYIIEKKFMLIDEYFQHPQFKLPLMLKKLSHESEISHREKVKKYLLACPDTMFTEYAHLINPESQFQMGFYNLYNEVTHLRAERQSTKEEEKKFKCTIF